MSPSTCQNRQLKVWPRQFRSRSWSTAFAVVIINDKYQPQVILENFLLALENFLLALIVFEIFALQFVTLKCRLRSECATFAVAPFEGKYMTSYLMALEICAISFAVCAIFTKQEKCRTFNLENEGQGQGVEEWDLRHSTRNVRIHIAECFHNFSYWATYVYAKADTHTHVHTQRQKVMLT